MSRAHTHVHKRTHLCHVFKGVICAPQGVKLGCQSNPTLAQPPLLSTPLPPTPPPSHKKNKAWFQGKLLDSSLKGRQE